MALPDSFQAGVNTDNRLSLSGYSASLRWNLKPRHIVQENYITVEGGTVEADMP